MNSTFNIVANIVVYRFIYNISYNIYTCPEHLYICPFKKKLNKSVVSLEGSAEIHMARSDKVQSAVEQIEHIDLPLQNGGTKPQEENPDPSK